MFIKKLSMFLFIIGSLIAILGGAFPFANSHMESFCVLLLIIIGTFIGFINISRHEEHGFLVAGSVFIISTAVLTSILERFLLLDIINKILHNLIILIAPACIVVGLKLIFEFASESEWETEKEKKELIEHLYKRLTHKEILWDDVILLSVSVAFVIFILQLFFDVAPYKNIITAIDYVIILIFVADLVFIYRKLRNPKLFFKTSWLDIIAVIPLGIIFRLAKAGRFIKIISAMSNAQKIEKINRPVKFFSRRTDVAERRVKRNKK
ncbi:MAG: hypothetical protein N3D84_03050 [Candidatus Woesearchaeota archaeon]|nr:hypothetical protein [Candidatus Woesearchaeota archaeon]